MTVEERIKREERNGELYIDYFRIGLAVLFSIMNTIIVIVRYDGRFSFATKTTFWGLSIFLTYGLGLLVYLRKRIVINSIIKYISTVIDMSMISLVLFSTRFDASMSAPAAFYLSRGLIYFLFIIFGMLRYSVPSAIFSGAVAATLYGIVCFSAYSYMATPFYGMVNGKQIQVEFPVDNEIFRVIFLFVAGILVAIGSRRNQRMLHDMAQQEAEATHDREATLKRTKEIAITMRDAAKEIDTTSKDILSTAHAQSASVEEIRTTVEENTSIAAQISEKTGSVATIAAKTENDVKSGFSVLEKNIGKMGEIKEKNNHIINGIISLGNEIAKIRDIVKTINAITDQTKVIAFNAALEAASAGETGKRFAVVASETNRLADDITALTKQIKDQIEEIRGAAATLIVTSEEGTDKISEGYTLIRTLEDVFKDISAGAEITSKQAQLITTSTQKQQKSSEQISTAIGEISQGLASFIAATKTNAMSVDRLTRIAEELQTTLSEQSLKPISPQKSEDPKPAQMVV